MKPRISKNLTIHSLWLLAALTALAIQPLSAQARSYNVLYSFTKDSVAWQYLSSSLVPDPQGNLYGVALGGTFGRGIIFKRVALATNWCSTISMDPMRWRCSRFDAVPR